MNEWRDFKVQRKVKSVEIIIKTLKAKNILKLFGWLVWLFGWEYVKTNLKWMNALNLICSQTIIYAVLNYFTKIWSCCWSKRDSIQNSANIFFYCLVVLCRSQQLESMIYDFPWWQWRFICVSPRNPWIINDCLIPHKKLL